MIRVSVFYPETEGASFDHDYYRDKHVPLCVRTWSPLSAEIDKGIDGPNVAAVHLTLRLPRRAAAGDGCRGHGRHPRRRRELHDDHPGPADERDRRLREAPCCSRD